MRPFGALGGTPAGEPAPTALCVLRCERHGYGVLITMTVTGDVEASAGDAPSARFLRAEGVLEEVRRFLAAAGVPD